MEKPKPKIFNSNIFPRSSQFGLFWGDFKFWSLFQTLSGHTGDGDDGPVAD
jgi:hypothetical protein